MGVKNRFKGAGGFRLNPLSLARGEWQIDSVPVIATAAQINSLSGTGSSPVTFIYVDGIDGDDSIGNGQIGVPFKTISAAYAFITDNSAAKPYLIICDPAQYIITGNFILRPYIDIQGNGATLTITGQITRDSTYTNAGDRVKISDFNNVDIQGGINLDFTGALGTCIFEISDLQVSTTTNWNIVGDVINGIFIIFDSIFGSQENPNFNFKNVAGTLVNSAALDFSYENSSSTTPFPFSLRGCTILGNVLLKSSNTQNFTAYIKDNLILGNFLVQAASTGQPTCFYSGNSLFGSFTLDGVDALLTTEVFNKEPLLINGALASNIAYIDISNTLSANYVPANYSPVDDSVNGHLRGIDAALLGAGSSMAQLVWVSKDGSDITGNGSFGKPFLTFNFAMAHAGTLFPTSTNIISIVMTPGVYPQSTTMQILPWVNIVGIGRPVILFTATNVIAPLNPFGTFGAAKVFFQSMDLVFNESQNIDFTGGGAAILIGFLDCMLSKVSGKIVTFNNVVNTLMSIYFNNNSNFTSFSSFAPSAVLLDIIFNNVQRVFLNNSYFNNITLNNIGFGSTYVITNSKTYGTFAVTKSGAPIPSFYTISNSNLNALSANSDINISIDAVSYPLGSLTLLDTAALTLTTVSNSIRGNYAPVHYTPTDLSIKGHLEGIDNALVFPLVTVTGTSQAMAVNTGYITNNLSLVTLTLPVIAAVGDKFSVRGLGAGGWRISQNASQSIRLGNIVSTVGVTGYVASTNQYDDVDLECAIANTLFKIVSVIGNPDLL